VIETHKGGRQTLNAAELTDVLTVVEDLPAGVALLENLAHPVGWSVVAHIALRHRTRGELNGCGDAARISEQLRSLRRARAILDRDETILLLEPAKHLQLLDLVDRIAGCTCAPSKQPASTSSTRSAAAPRASAMRELRARTPKRDSRDPHVQLQRGPYPRGACPL
jgi:hypothetical protein